MNERGRSINDERVLILAPTMKDAKTTETVFQQHNISSYICKDIAELRTQMKQGLGAMVVTQEAILSDEMQKLNEDIKQQPPWSDYPLIVLTPAGTESPAALKALESVGHMTLMKRPVQVSTLISALVSGLRDRRRQYKIRDLLDGYQSATQKAEQASLAKSEFLANMSHEIRTPMNAIVGLTSILATHKAPPERQRECLNTLRLSAESLMEIINNLLDISKIESESVELENIPFDLCMLLQEVISIMNVKAVEKNIALKFELNAHLNGEFLGDPTRLKQILMNLIGNAIKFTGEGAVTLRAVPEPADEGRTIVNFSVADTGIGVHESKLKILFNKFSQADSTITRKYGGTGLGLAITKKLVELMGGEISVSSEIGKGSIFTARIPYIRCATTATMASSDIRPGEVPSIASATQHILLVEDSPANILVATSMLENLGYKFDTAKDGEEAIQKYKSGKFDLLLMDVQMPRMDGYSATRLIRQHELKHSILRIPIIGVTAHAFADDREKCLHAGMDDYMSKPFGQAALNQKICQLLHKSDGKYPRLTEDGAKLQIHLN